MMLFSGYRGLPPFLPGIYTAEEPPDFSAIRLAVAYGVRPRDGDVVWEALKRVASS